MKTPPIKTGTIGIDNFKLQFCIEGKGPDTLIIGSSVYYPRTFSKNLRKNLRLIFVDHRGFSEEKSDIKNPELHNVTLDTIIDDIEKIRKELCLPRIILVGHSGHGYMALEYAKKYPEAVRGIVLLAMSPASNQESFAAADRYFEESVCPERKKLLKKNLKELQKAFESNPKQIFITRLQKFSPMICYDPELDTSYLWKDVKIIPDILHYLWGKVFQELDITKNLHRINVPVFVGLGRYDYWNPPYLWEKVRASFKNLTIRVFEQSGHTPQLEEPEFFDAELLKWISTQNISS